MLFDLFCQPWVGHGGASQHHISDATDLHTTLVVCHRPDFAIRQYRHIHDFGNACNPFPVRRWFVALRFGAGMNHQLGNTCRVECTGIIQCQLCIVITQPHFGSQHRVGGLQCFCHRFTGFIQFIGITQHTGTTQITVHCFSRATKVEIDHLGSNTRSNTGIGCQRLGITAQQLNMHRHTGWSQGILSQLRTQTVKNPTGLTPIGHPKKLGDTKIPATLTSHQITRGGIHHAFHRCQRNPWQCFIVQNSPVILKKQLLLQKRQFTCQVAGVHDQSVVFSLKWQKSQMSAGFIFLLRGKACIG